jgi:diacylglycerol O-acyltransferase / wax synthase
VVWDLARITVKASSRPRGFPRTEPRRGPATLRKIRREMRRLSSFDANFLYLESPTAHMHVGSLAIFDPSTADGRWGVERVRRIYADRIHLVPQFRRRLAEVPLQLDHPHWVDDPEFDLGWHIRHIAVPAPGGPHELAELAGELMATPLDRNRPLWEVWVIDGVTGGRFAVLTKAHHAAMDGMAGVRMVSSMFDLTPDVEPAPPPAQPWQPEPVPGDIEMLARAAGSMAVQPLRTVRAIRRGTHALRMRRRIIAQEGHGSLAETLPAGAPKVSFSAPLTPERLFAFRTLSLAKAKAVKNATGTTVNDVILAVCGGGLARYLDGRGEDVDGSLVAMVPMSVRGDDTTAADANKLMNMFIRLGTDLPDPLDRLASIARQTASGKAQLRGGEGDPVRELSDLAPATLTAHMFRFIASHHLAERVTPLFNLTMSNLAGSPTPLFLGGALLVANYPLAPIYDGNGLNITVLSYLDQLDVGIVACPQLSPDGAELPVALEAALDELVALTR